jgi:hypothetical protein
MAAMPFAVPPQPTRRTIPFDYSFTFKLEGKPQRSVSATVMVSVEGAFVANGIGYGFVPLVEPVRFGGTRAEFQAPRGSPPFESGPVTLQEITFDAVLNLAAKRLNESQARLSGGIGAQTGAVLEAGFRFNPELVNQILLGNSFDPIDDSLLANLFELVAPPLDEVQFLYALSDEATGRAFQSEPILNTAGLGDAKGERPFRQFAVPITFAPRTRIKMDVTEIQQAKGSLYVSLHGYKVLGGEGTPTGAAAQPPAPAAGRRRRMRR